MTTDELIRALRAKESRDNRALLDEAADRLERFVTVFTTVDTYIGTDGERYISLCELGHMIAQMTARENGNG